MEDLTQKLRACPDYILVRETLDSDPSLGTPGYFPARVGVALEGLVRHLAGRERALAEARLRPVVQQAVLDATSGYPIPTAEPVAISSPDISVNDLPLVEATTPVLT